MKKSKSLKALLALTLLAACGPLTHQDQLKALDQQIKIEQQRKELERLRQQNQPSASPTPSAEPQGPVSNNQSPRINKLEARLQTRVKTNDAVELVAEASDPDGDNVEFTWSSVFTGLTATRGQSVVWFPGDQKLAGRTNLITLTVTDRKGGSSTGTLNVFVQSDGTLLVRQNLAAQPVLQQLEITRPNPGQLRLKASALDPGGGTVRYSWSASKGLLGADSTDTTTWSASGNESGEVVIQLKMSNSDGSASSSLDYRFSRNADGTLSGDFSTIRGATAIAPAAGSTDGASFSGTLYGVRNNAIVSASLATGGLLELYNLAQTGSPGEPRQMVYDGKDTLYLYNGFVHALSLSKLQVNKVELPAAGAQGIFMFQGQPCVLTSSRGNPQVFVIATGQEIPMKNPIWSLSGQIGSQGIVASIKNSVVTASDPFKGIEQPLLDLEFGSAVLAWHPSGQQLAVLEGSTLHILGLDGSKSRLNLKHGATQLLWHSDKLLLGISGLPGKLDVKAIDPKTGEIKELSSAIKTSLGSLSLMIPGL